MTDFHACAWCGKLLKKPTGEMNRARKAGLKLYCSRKHSGLGRRKWKTKAQRVKEKRLYDMEYRTKNRETLKAKKRSYFKRTYDPAKAAIERKKTMKRHIEYCRRPEYKAWKREYDKRLKESSPRRKFRLPAFAPDSLVETFQLMRALRQEKRKWT